MSVSRVDGRLEIEVADDGRGFDPARRTAGFGLAGMHERVTLSGGEPDVRPGEAGTTLRATTPLSEVADVRASGSSRLRA